jgi:hypothetical protein
VTVASGVASFSKAINRDQQLHFKGGGSIKDGKKSEEETFQKNKDKRGC